MSFADLDQKAPWRGNCRAFFSVLSAPFQDLLSLYQLRNKTISTFRKQPSLTITIIVIWGKPQKQRKNATYQIPSKIFQILSCELPLNTLWQNSKLDLSKTGKLNFGAKIVRLENQIAHFKIYHPEHKNADKRSIWHFYECFGRILQSSNAFFTWIT